MRAILILLVAVSCNVVAQETVQQSSAYKEIRIVPVDSVGNKMYHQQQYVIEGNKIIPIDNVGNRQYFKKSFQQENQNVKTK